MNKFSDERDKLLSTLQADAFNYFLNEVKPDNGLVADCTKPGWPSSIAAVGMALSVYPVAVERGFITSNHVHASILVSLTPWSVLAFGLLIRQGATNLCHAIQDSGSNHVPKRMFPGQWNAGGAYPAIVKMDGVLGGGFCDLPDVQCKRD